MGKVIYLDDYRKKKLLSEDDFLLKGRCMSRKELDEQFKSITSFFSEIDDQFKTLINKNNNEE